MFSESLLPVDVAPNASMGAQFKTSIIQLRGGGEFRQTNWSQPLRSFSVRYGARIPDDLQSLVSFILEVQGNLVAFRARDWSDYTATDEDVAVADGVSDFYRLQKAYNSHNRRILKILSVGFTVSINDVPLTSDEFCLDVNNGVIIFRDVPTSGDVIKWSGEFYVPVRFTDDIMEVMMFFKDAGRTENIGLKEVRLTEDLNTSNYATARATLSAQDRAAVVALGLPGIE